MFAQQQSDTVPYTSIDERLKAEPQKDPEQIYLPAFGRMHKGAIYFTDKNRVRIVAIGSAALWTGTFIALNQAWYTDYNRSSFHFFNDNSEWKQVDKAGHIWTSYQISRVTTEAWRWTGLPDKKSILLGGISGVAFQTIIEIQDAYSQKWGFSWGDMASNVVGAGIFMLQEWEWKEQRVSVKFSYWPHDYPDNLVSRRNDLFGNHSIERILKDYNSQTYWLSGNLKSFFKKSSLPPWLNISFGYHAEGMLGGKENSWIDENGNRVTHYEVMRTRHYLLSPDIDFTKIHTNKKLVRKLFFLLNAIKMPAPALELNSNGKLSLHALYF